MGLLTAKISTIFILFCCLQPIGAQAKLIKFDKKFGYPFDTSIFEVIAPAQISNKALQLTPENVNTDSDFELFFNSGRIFLKQSFKLWDSNKNGSMVGSFNSSFLVNISRINNRTAGEGLAFLISPDLELPPNSQGKYLGLTNSSIDGKSTNKVVAVELDTFKQDIDIDDNHIGIDIHSVRSVKSEPLTPHGINLAPVGERFYNIWVQYNGTKKILDVYVVEQKEKNGSTPPRPSNPILTHNLDLRDVVNQESYFGFSASTGKSYQSNSVLRWNLTVEYFYAKNHRLEVGLGIGVPIVVVFLILAAWFGYYYHKKWIDRSEQDILGALKNLPGMPRDYEFKVLKKATNNFDEKNKLGEGGYGKVYKGYLAGEKLEIAVKWFSRESIDGQDDFLA